MPKMNESYYRDKHLEILQEILMQLERIANAIQGDVLEPEEVYSKETLNNLRQACACTAAVPPEVVRNLEEELQAFNFNPPANNKN